MPTYEYQCRKCGHLFEAFQSISEEPIKQCPVCPGPVRRLISSGAGLIFKGSGFYITDYKKKEQKQNRSKKEDNTKKEVGKKDSKSTDSKSKNNKESNIKKSN
jgi:putative FmdB family regulatory protein